MMSAARESARGPDAAGRGIRALERVEADHGLLTLEWDGVHVWSLVRLAVSQDILTALGVFDYTSTLQQRTPQRPLHLKRNPLLSTGRKPIMVFRYGRSMARRGRKLDPYTDPIAADLNAVRAHVVELSPDPVDDALPFASRTVCNEPLRLTWGRVAGRLWRRPATMPSELAARLTEAEAALRLQVPCPIKLVDRVASAKAEYDRQFRLWAPAFAISRPRLVLFGTQCYGYEGIVGAAKYWGATVAELQHGIVYDGHLSYHFPERVQVNHAPHLFLTFGRWWNDRFNYPLGLQTLATGYKLLDEALDEHGSEPAADGGLAVLSGDQLFDATLVSALQAVRSQMPGVPIDIRPHPTDGSPYKQLCAQYGVDDVRVSCPRSESVHEFLARSAMTLCAATTSSLESTAMGRPTVAYLRGMTTIMGPVLEAGGVTVCSNLDDLGRAVAEAPPPRPPVQLFDRAETAIAELLNSYA